MPSFTPTHYNQLNDKMQVGLITTELSQLHQLLGGQPYLTRLAFYHLSKEDSRDFNAFINSAADEQGPFGSHLRALKAQLNRRKALLQALRQVLQGKSQLDDDRYLSNCLTANTAMCWRRVR